MSVQQMKKKCEQFVEHIWNRADFDRITDYLTEDYLEHRPEGTVEGVEGLRQLVSAMRDSYPDLRIEVHDIAADEDFVACTYIVEGTMLGDLGTIKATSKPVRIEGIYMGRIEGDRIGEAWNRYDMLDLLMQLGVVSAPASDLTTLIASQQPEPPA